MTKASSRAARDEEPEPSVTVADTGDAQAAGDETAVTGYRGPAPGNGLEAPISVDLSHTGNATATNGATAISGYVHNMTVQRAPREPACWPHRVGVIPSQARSFQHRGEADRLRAAVEGGGTAVLSQVLTGMGGVGKTQLAADYARAAWDEGALDVLVWVTASAQPAVVSAYAQAGVELCRADPEDPEQAARQFLASLAPRPGQRPCRWLVVLDDVADPNDLIVHADDAGSRFSLWPPASPHGRTLLTTRRRDAALFGDGRRRIEVGLFTPDESLAHLTAALHAQGRSEPADQLTALAADLGHLPLALAQAAAYLIDSSETAAGYRTLLADRATKLTHLAPDSLPDEQATALAAAWSLSIERADTLRPAGLARPMLHLAALLDANGIPQSVLTSEPARAHLAAHRTATGPTPEPNHVSPRDAVGALRALHRLSLIDHQPDTPLQAVRIHQLIQRATRDTHTPDQHDQAARTAADALLAAWPDNERDTDLALSLRANADALIRHAGDALCRPADGAHVVLFRAGTSLAATGQITAAVDYYKRLADTIRRRLGDDHPDTLIARQNLGQWRGQEGNVTDAIAELEAVRDDMASVLGAASITTLTARANHAYWRGENGDAAGAVADLEVLVEEMGWSLGPSHSHTLTVRYNLALWRMSTGDVTGAVTALARLVQEMTEALGPDDFRTLLGRGTLARWRGEQGEAAEATVILEQVAERMGQVLGPDHPHTLTTRQYLAINQGLAGDAAGATVTFQHLLTDLERLRDPEDPLLLTVQRQLADCRGDAGDAAGAVDAFRKILQTTKRRLLAPAHPDVVLLRYRLAHWRGMAGDAAGAADAYKELLADLLRALDPDHPHVLQTRTQIAIWQDQAGDSAGAVTALREDLRDKVQLFGPEHLETLATRERLANARAMAGDAAGAADELEEILAVRTRLSGHDAPDTLVTRRNLATWRGKAGDVATATAALQDVLADFVRVLGPHHPETLVTQHNFATSRGRSGDPTGAATALKGLLESMTAVHGPEHLHVLATRRSLAEWQAAADRANGRC
ncbi:FxSxx-COOH system tetratricopeptide repeat protein [Streptomyces massasporeus]|uniref:FxSxx-COOH system tetratricopeptide repeat protein n=1 Tax=Streptomyces massasporeus TaxID=67324 RepID=UPI003827D2E6